MNNQDPPVYKAVRAVGILRPQIQLNQQGRIFVDKLDVIGTSFWLKDYRVLITCAHVVAPLLGAPVEITGLLVIGNRGNYKRAVIDAIDFIHDLAILRLPSDIPQTTIDQESQDGLEIIDKYPEVGERISYSGFPLGIQLLNSTHAPTYSNGVIGAKIRAHNHRKDIQITGTVTGGFSGSPIVLENLPNKVIGVLSNSPSNEAGRAGFFMAVSWEHIKALAELSRS